MGMKLSMPLKGEAKGVEKIFSKKKKGVEMKRIGSSSKSGLPEDLVFEILLLLPVKSLLRFRCVCKSWYDLIGNPSFVSMQYYKSSNDDTSKFIVERNHDALLLSNETLKLCHDLDLTPVENIVGSCYGIICFRGHVLKEYSVNLWNPSTRQFKVLPKPHHTPDVNDDFDVEFGFCYDVKTNDFKVVKFVTLVRPSDSHWVAHADALHPTPTPPAEVYTLSTDSWKIIHNTLLPSMYLKSWRSVNGVLSNLSNKFGTEKDLVLVSFDTRDEVFLLTPLPAPCAGTRMVDYGDIAPLNESVAYVQDLSGSGKFCHFFNIWVLNEYGSKGSWTKLYTIGEPTSNLLNHAWAFWKNSMLLMKNEEGQLVLCDLITQEIKNLQVGKLIILDLISYKESLVSI